MSRSRYGKDQVAQIITFGKLQARAVCRDVGRVLQMPYGQVDRLCKLIPMNPANPVTLAQAIDGEPRLQEERDKDPAVKTMLEIGLKLEGLYRHASTHAAGIVIGDRPLEELVPLYRDPRSSIPATQFNMKYVEKAGLVKFDFLGLKTLTVIDKAQQLIRMRVPDFDTNKIPLDDAATFDMLGQGDTVGVFQLESSGMRDAVRQMRADRFEDLIALVALYRPGPMANIPLYCARKLGREPIEYLHPSLEPILKETYGVITYQEQVQQIAKDLAGYTLARGRSSAPRHGQEDQVRDGRAARALPRRRGRARHRSDRSPTIIFDACAKFAEYGFNKSHSAPYAYISYQTAYLKANYPVEFLAASMSLDMGNTDKLQMFRREAQRLGVPIVPPSLNASRRRFRGEGRRRPLFARRRSRMSAQAPSSIWSRSAARAARSPRSAISPAASMRTYSTGGRLKAWSRRAPSMSFSPTARGSSTASMPSSPWPTAPARKRQPARTISSASRRARRRTSRLPAREAWLPMDRLAQEFEAVGFYLSGHPLDDYMTPLAKAWRRYLGLVPREGADQGRHRREARRHRHPSPGAALEVRQQIRLCRLLRSDRPVRDDLLFRHARRPRDLLEPGKAVIARVEADVDGEEVRLRLQGVEELEEAAAGHHRGPHHLRARCEADRIRSPSVLTNGGTAPVTLILQMDTGPRGRNRARQQIHRDAADQGGDQGDLRRHRRPGFVRPLTTLRHPPGPVGGVGLLAGGVMRSCGCLCWRRAWRLREDRLGPVSCDFRPTLSRFMAALGIRRPKARGEQKELSYGGAKTVDFKKRFLSRSRSSSGPMTASSISSSLKARPSNMRSAWAAMALPGRAATRLAARRSGRIGAHPR